MEKLLFKETNIAHQCPLAGGMSVYKARSLYSIVNDEAEYDDTGVCNALGMNMRKAHSTVATVSNIFSVYPNPVESVLTIRWNQKDSHPSEWVLTDIMGKEMYGSTIVGELSETTLSVKGLSSGIYVLVIKDGTQVLHQEKIIVHPMR